MNYKNNVNFSNIKKGVIYYFSGTGNTLWIVNKYLELFSKEKIDIDLVDISKTNTVGSQSKYDFLCFAYPTYACNPPAFIKAFVNKFPKVNNKPCFLISTAAKIHWDVLGLSARILRKKGYNIIATFKYYMPHNISFMFGIHVSKDVKINSILDKADKKIKSDFINLINRQAKPNFSSFAILSSIVSWFFNNFIIKSNVNHWTIDKDKCVLCGLCENICPNNNITIKHKKKKVIFGKNCLFCGRCYNFCPQKAIDYKNNKFKKDFGRYIKFKDLLCKDNTFKK